MIRFLSFRFILFFVVMMGIGFFMVVKHHNPLFDNVKKTEQFMWGKAVNAIPDHYLKNSMNFGDCQAVYAKDLPPTLPVSQQHQLRENCDAITEWLADYAKSQHQFSGVWAIDFQNPVVWQQAFNQ